MNNDDIVGADEGSTALAQPESKKLPTILVAMMVGVIIALPAWALMSAFSRRAGLVVGVFTFIAFTLASYESVEGANPLKLLYHIFLYTMDVKRAVSRFLK